MRRFHCVPLLFLFLIMALAGAPLRAQTVDTSIGGTVTDSSGAVVPGATVTVSSSRTGSSKQAVSAPSGDYNITYLAPGTYDLTVSRPGFGTLTERHSAGINQQAKINVVMNVAAQQTVEVNRTTVAADRRRVPWRGCGADSAPNLPLNGRKFDDLAILTPGVTVYNPDNHSSTADGSAISAYGGHDLVAGQRRRRDHGE